MGKFENDITIIQEFLKKIGNLTRTKIVKLLYLLDIESVAKYGKQVTNFEYRKYYYGPYDENIINLLDERQYFSVGLGITSSGNQYYNYTVGPKKNDHQMDNNTKELVDSIVNKYGQHSLDKILEIAYATTQFKNTNFGEKIKLC